MFDEILALKDAEILRFLINHVFIGVTTEGCCKYHLLLRKIVMYVFT